MKDRDFADEGMDEGGGITAGTESSAPLGNHYKHTFPKHSLQERERVEHRCVKVRKCHLSRLSSKTLL